MIDLKRKIREIPDFPQKGVSFKDIAPLLEDYQSLRRAINLIYQHFKDRKVDKVLAVDARGFILGALLADRFRAGMVMVRKKGKLPFKTVGEEYDLEYGRATLEIHVDSIKPGEQILLVDDVLATGGTMKATCNLVEKLGGQIVGIGLLIDLTFLKGKEKLKNYDCYSLISYNS